MEMTNVTAQTSKAASGTTQNGMVVAAVENGQDASFGKMLIQVLDGGETETETTNADISAALGAVIIPAGVLLASAPQTNISETEELVQQLLAAVQSPNPEQLQKLLDHPALQQWLAQANRSIGATTDATSFVIVDGKSSDDDPELLTPLPEHPSLQRWFGQVNHRSIGATAEAAVLPYKDGKPTGDDPLLALLTVTDDTTELLDVLTRFLQHVRAGSNEPSVQQLAVDFKTMMNELSQGFPALAVKTEPLDGANQDSFLKTADSAVVKTDNLLLNVSSAGTRKESGNQSSDKNGSPQQFLQRLSFMKPLVHVVSVHDGLSARSEETAAGGESPAGIMSAADKTLSDQAAPPLAALSEPLKESSAAAIKAPLPTMQAQHFATEMSRFIVKNMSITQLGGLSEAKITLVPEHLGQLDVKISVHNGQITAHFVAESAGARDLLENQLPLLRSALQQQGLQVEKLVVSQNESYQSGMFQEHRQHRQSSGQYPGNGNKSDASYDRNSAEFSLEIEQAVAVGGIRGFGSSFHASA